MKTVIRNGRIVTAVDDYEADILIEDGKVAMNRKAYLVYAGRASTFWPTHSFSRRFAFSRSRLRVRERFEKVASKPIMAESQTYGFEK